jgi:hypothetical protein
MMFFIMEKSKVISVFLEFMQACSRGGGGVGHEMA